MKFPIPWHASALPQRALSVTALKAKRRIRFANRPAGIDDCRWTHRSIHRPEPVRTALPASFSKKNLRPDPASSGAAFVPAAPCASAVKRGRGVCRGDACTCKKCPIHRDILNPADGTRKPAAPLRPRASIRVRIAQGAALSMRTGAPHTRFVNADDVFFLCSVVIESAAPTIRVRADVSPTLALTRRATW
jgi:hypothetical protein